MTPINRSIRQKLSDLTQLISPGSFFLVLIFGALIAFELFNYSTTDHALQDLLGGLKFGPLAWSTILALAFCGIDFAGIARLFTPEQGVEEPKEVWYLFGAWLLAATMNAILTWWGVSMAITNHQVTSASSGQSKDHRYRCPCLRRGDGLGHSNSDHRDLIHGVGSYNSCWSPSTGWPPPFTHYPTNFICADHQFEPGHARSAAFSGTHHSPTNSTE